MKKPKKIYAMSCDIEDSHDSTTISDIPETNTNQIMVYGELTEKSILSLNKDIDRISKNLLISAINLNLREVPSLELYINSPGGDIISSLSTVDRIRSSKVPIISYVEGMAASAATIISVVAPTRYIRQNSIMLIHQLSSENWAGNYNQLKDEMYNMDLLMKTIKSIYLKYTKLTESELDSLLTRDLYLTAQECLEKGLVDQIV